LPPEKNDTWPPYLKVVKTELGARRGRRLGRAGRQWSVDRRIGGQLDAITGGSGSSSGCGRTGEQQIIDVAAAAVATEAGGCVSLLLGLLLLLVVEHVDRVHGEAVAA